MSFINLLEHLIFATSIQLLTIHYQLSTVKIAALTQIINEFRAITARNSITPEALGYLLQQIVNKIATVENQEEILEVEELSSSLAQLSASLDALATSSAIAR